MDTGLTYDALLTQSIEELRIKTAGHDATWHITKADWNVDQNRGTVEFTTPDYKATCAVQIIGTYNKDDGTWFWAWGHPSVLPALQSHARLVLAFGQQQNIQSLTTQKLQCPESAAWGFTALACKLAGAQGGYCGPSGSTQVYMTFSDVKVHANKPG